MKFYDVFDPSISISSYRDFHGDSVTYIKSNLNGSQASFDKPSNNSSIKTSACPVTCSKSCPKSNPHSNLQIDSSSSLLLHPSSTNNELDVIRFLQEGAWYRSDVHHSVFFYSNFPAPEDSISLRHIISHFMAKMFGWSVDSAQQADSILIAFKEFFISPQVISDLYGELYFNLFNADFSIFILNKGDFDPLSTHLIDLFSNHLHKPSIVIMDDSYSHFIVHGDISYHHKDFELYDSYFTSGEWDVIPADLKYVVSDFVGQPLA